MACHDFASTCEQSSSVSLSYKSIAVVHIGQIHNSTTNTLSSFVKVGFVGSQNMPEWIYISESFLRRGEVANVVMYCKSPFLSYAEPEDS